MWHVTEVPSSHTYLQMRHIHHLPQTEPRCAGIVRDDHSGTERNISAGAEHHHRVEILVKLRLSSPTEEDNPFTYLHPELLIFQTGLKKKDYTLHKETRELNIYSIPFFFSLQSYNKQQNNVIPNRLQFPKCFTLNIGAYEGKDRHSFGLCYILTTHKKGVQ